jgi:hypothetical protein
MKSSVLLAIVAALGLSLSAGAAGRDGDVNENYGGTTGGAGGQPSTAMPGSTQPGNTSPGGNQPSGGAQQPPTPSGAGTASPGYAQPQPATGQPSTQQPSRNPGTFAVPQESSGTAPGGAAPSQPKQTTPKP